MREASCHLCRFLKIVRAQLRSNRSRSRYNFWRVYVVDNLVFKIIGNGSTMKTRAFPLSFRARLLIKQRWSLCRPPARLMGTRINCLTSDHLDRNFLIRHTCSSCIMIPIYTTTIARSSFLCPVEFHGQRLISVQKYCLKSKCIGSAFFIQANLCCQSYDRFEQLTIGPAMESPR